MLLYCHGNGKRTFTFKPHSSCRMSRLVCSKFFSSDQSTQDRSGSQSTGSLEGLGPQNGRHFFRIDGPLFQTQVSRGVLSQFLLVGFDNKQVSGSHRLQQTVIPLNRLQQLGLLVPKAKTHTNLQLSNLHGGKTLGQCLQVQRRLNTPQHQALQWSTVDHGSEQIHKIGRIWKQVPQIAVLQCQAPQCTRGARREKDHQSLVNVSDITKLQR